MKLQLKLWSRVLYILIIKNLNVYYYIPEKKNHKLYAGDY
jgi:hypothetical protein